VCVRSLQFASETIHTEQQTDLLVDYLYFNVNMIDLQYIVLNFVCVADLH